MFSFNWSVKEAEIWGYKIYSAAWKYNNFDQKEIGESELANLKRVAEWRGKFCLKAANQKSRKGEFAGKPSKLVKEFR